MIRNDKIAHGFRTMAVELLTTKLWIPPPSPHQLSRSRLVERFERDVPLYRITAVSAPAGYGKTTLLAQWARTSRFPVAWVSIGENDNELERFLRYLVAAWAAVQPQISEREVSIRLGAISPDIDAVLVAFINASAEFVDQTVFVLDDAHLIIDDAVQQALAFLLDHLPAHIHVVLAGRGALPVPLARYRARDELLEYRAGDLRFGIDDTTSFLNDLMSLELRERDVVQIHAQLEGWPAGLQLVALSWRRSTAAKRPLGISGRHRFIADYLNEDVLAWLPEHILTFLLQTSILQNLNRALCDAVTGRNDSQAILETLERENLFIVPMDENRDWYRYHRLFADVLHQELDRLRPGEVSDLHRRAARWYLEARLPELALHHALVADDHQAGFEIFDSYTNVLLNTGQLKMLQRWLDQVPAGWREQHTAFGLAEAGLMLFSGAFEAGSQRIDEIEQRLTELPAASSQPQLGRVTAIRCFIACILNDLAQAEMFAERALRQLPEENLGFRPGIFAALGDTYRRHGHWKEAKKAYLTALESSQTPTVRALSAHLYGALADLELRQGQLRSAAGYWRKMLAAVQEPENWGTLPLPASGWVELRLGELLYEWNDLGEAHRHLERGLERAEFGGDVQSLLAGYLISARLKLTEGDIGGSAECLERARPHVEVTVFPDWSSRFERIEVDLWLARHKFSSAVHWANSVQLDDSLEERPENEPSRLALARILVLKADAPSIDRALALLDRLIQAAEQEGRAGVQIESLAVRALAFQQRGDLVTAMTALEHALRLAEPEGYVRLFVDLGQPMTQLLQAARSRKLMPGYVSTLLTASGADLTSISGREEALPVPLSERETEVLHRIATGLTNREIAGILFVSPETVKKHAGSIYGKLGVRSRTEAVARARELDLLH